MTYRVVTEKEPVPEWDVYPLLREDGGKSNKTRGFKKVTRTIFVRRSEGSEGE